MNRIPFDDTSDPLCPSPILDDLAWKDENKEEKRKKRGGRRKELWEKKINRKKKTISGERVEGKGERGRKLVEKMISREKEGEGKKRKREKRETRNTRASENDGTRYIYIWYMIYIEYRFHSRKKPK